ncbi:MAG: ABC transporter ATP-binding protein [Chloroflexota bacterium]
MIEIQNVSKSFYTFKAIDGVSLKIPMGEVVGILGPNGAGKSTLFKLISGLLKPDDGDILATNGRIWPKIGYKPDRLLLPNHLRIGQYLKTIARLSNVPEQVVQQTTFDSLVKVDLVNAADKKIRDCSKGMRQRIGLAQALIGNPPLLLLDEPSNGLDPTGQSDMNRRVQELHAEGKTIIISSHQLHEITKTCTQLVILKNGRIHYEKSMSDALSTSSHTIIETDKIVEGALATQILSLHDDVQFDGLSVILRNEAMSLRRQIITMLLMGNYDVVHVVENKRSLAEIYAEVVA